MTPQELKQIRIEMSKSQQEMASLLCVNIRTYQRYEVGQLKVPTWVVRILELKTGKYIN